MSKESGEGRVIVHALYQTEEAGEGGGFDEQVYICNQSFSANKYRGTFNDKEVTCKNCLRIIEKKVKATRREK